MNAKPTTTTTATTTPTTPTTFVVGGYLVVMDGEKMIHAELLTGAARLRTVRQQQSGPGLDPRPNALPVGDWSQAQTGAGKELAGVLEAPPPALPGRRRPLPMNIQEIEVARKMHPNFVAAVSDYDFGFDAYMAKWPIDRLAKDDEKRGWWAALNAEALANMPVGMREWEPTDEEWIRRGC